MAYAEDRPVKMLAVSTPGYLKNTTFLLSSNAKCPVLQRDLKNREMSSFTREECYSSRSSGRRLDSMDVPRIFVGGAQPQFAMYFY